MLFCIVGYAPDTVTSAFNKTVYNGLYDFIQPIVYRYTTDCMTIYNELYNSRQFYTITLRAE